MISCKSVINRNFSTTSALLKAQSSRFMNKVLKEKNKNKKWQTGEGYSSSNIPFPTNLAEGANEGRRSANSKRVSVLNKVFMRHITDLMATGCSSSQFLGRGIEINRVMVTPDFKGVNVFWIAKGTENDDNIEKLLSQNAGALRHELSQLRVMGIVPKINFVKDKEYAKLVEVDNRLAKADFGEDYVRVEPSYRFKSEFSLNTSLPNDVKEQINALECDEDEAEEEIPPMRNDIFALNHFEIMEKVQKYMNKAQASHRKNENNKNTLSLSTNEDPIQYYSQKQQKEAFQQFLMKRQILRAKAKKDKEKYNPEYEYFKSENIEYFQNIPFLDDRKEMEDYLEETEDKQL